MATSLTLTLTVCFWIVTSSSAFDLTDFGADSGAENGAADVERNNDFDFFVFSQLWPVSDCLDWKRFDGQFDRKDHTCNLTDFDFTSFTVHGLWPTRISEEGPQFCNKSLHFNATALDPILDQLEERWHQVRAGTELYAFWKHEWVKHGTCAAQLPALDAEFKYFSKGLELQEKYNVYDMLKGTGVIPGGQYAPKEVMRKLRHELNKAWNTTVRPAISCVFLKKVVLLYEVRICLDKDFSLRDCGQSAGGIFNNCLDKDTDYILYPDKSSIGVTFWQLLAFICLVMAAVCVVLGGCVYHGLTNYKSLDVGPPPRGWKTTKDYTKLYNEAVMEGQQQQATATLSEQRSRTAIAI